MAISGPVSPAFAEILTPEACAFLLALHEQFEGRRQELLAERQTRQLRLDAGEMPDFLESTRSIRASEWTVAPIPADLQDRRVEITGPTDRKMVINALNSGAKVFMADFEDSLAPAWNNLLEGQINLRDAIRGTITYDDPQSGRAYRLNPETALLLVRPRGWHLPEQHIQIAGKPMSGSLMDFGLFFFTNAQALTDRGSAPYFYLPKLESHLEARLWNDVFVFAQRYLGIPNGTIRATVLIETILAAFELDEILWELRDHAAGLNCGRWDYIFSFIKKFRMHPAFVLPDRGQVTMTAPFMRAYSLRVIQVCHRRGCHAIGGMAAQIPIKNNADANDAALEKVKADKLREVSDGHDGTWVAHPGLVPLVLPIFNEHMPQPNQIDRLRPDLDITPADLLRLPDGQITEAGIRLNINVGIQYLEHWLRGYGCVTLNNLMEDAATAEISRAQLWQWLHHSAIYDGDKVFSTAVYTRLRDEELEAIRRTIGDAAFESGQYRQAVTLFNRLVTAPYLENFLTTPAYDILLTTN
jgi:malate synthase